MPKLQGSCTATTQGLCLMDHSSTQQRSLSLSLSVISLLTCRCGSNIGLVGLQFHLQGTPYTVSFSSAISNAA